MQGHWFRERQAGGGVALPFQSAAQSMSIFAKYSIFMLLLIQKESKLCTTDWLLQRQFWKKETNLPTGTTTYIRFPTLAFRALCCISVCLHKILCGTSIELFWNISSYTAFIWKDPTNPHIVCKLLCDEPDVNYSTNWEGVSWQLTTLITNKGTYNLLVKHIRIRHLPMLERKEILLLTY